MNSGNQVLLCFGLKSIYCSWRNQKTMRQEPRSHDDEGSAVQQKTVQYKVLGCTASNTDKDILIIYFLCIYD